LPLSDKNAEENSVLKKNEASLTVKIKKGLIHLWKVSFTLGVNNISLAAYVGGKNP